MYDDTIFSLRRLTVDYLLVRALICFPVFQPQCWQSCNSGRSRNATEQLETAVPPVNDVYVIPGLPRVDRARRRLVWGKLLKKADSVWVDYVDVGCDEPILYVVFCDRPLPHPNLDAFQEYHTWNFMRQVCDSKYTAVQGVVSALRRSGFYFFVYFLECYEQRDDPRGVGVNWQIQKRRLQYSRCDQGRSCGGGAVRVLRS
jgi:hypothetical protein